MSSSIFAEHIKQDRAQSINEPILDADGKPIKFDIREDEEQHIKSQQIIDLLLAAGYFRARIKGLSLFDKVVGGMCWCITSSNFDIDIDLLFQENLNVGQKIALTEKIVKVLLLMKCPHRLEPHQIQGVDFINIFPVMQWLVKKAIATREEMEDEVKSYGVYQFHKAYSKDIHFGKITTRSQEKSSSTTSHFSPIVRKYRRIPGSSPLPDEKSRVHSTLLEYGHRFFLAKSSSREGTNGELDKKKTLKDKHSQVMSSLEASQKDGDQSLSEEEQKRLDHLMGTLSETGHEGKKLTTHVVGGLVSGQSSEIQQALSNFAEKQAALERERMAGSGLAAMTPAAKHERTMEALKKQLTKQQKVVDQLTEERAQLLSQYKESKGTLKEMKSEMDSLEQQVESLLKAESDFGNPELVDKIKILIERVDKLKSEEHQFKASCKEEIERLTREIHWMKDSPAADDPVQREKVRAIEMEIDEKGEKLKRGKIKLARRNREIAVLQRKLDSVPSRAELNQYQRRFVELYNQVASTLRETRQFYTMYNALVDEKLYYDKQVDLMNSIYEGYLQVQQNKADMAQFLSQMERIVEGGEQTTERLQNRLHDQQQKRDELLQRQQNIVDEKRAYFVMVRDFKEECKKNEMLLRKLKELQLRKTPDEG